MSEFSPVRVVWGVMVPSWLRIKSEMRLTPLLAEAQPLVDFERYCFSAVETIVGSKVHSVLAIQ